MNATTNRQIQKAGDNASQIQAQTFVQNIGISEERVHDIVSAACDKAIESCLMESRLAVEQRLNSFKDELYAFPGINYGFSNRSVSHRVRRRWAQPQVLLQGLTLPLIIRCWLSY